MADFLRPDILDLVDILLVSFLIYRLLLLIQGTRAARMVLGLTLILVGSIIAQWLNLRGINWIIGSVKVAWVVAVAIIFQPEIRRALTQLGHNPLIRRILKVEHPQALDEVAEGAALLSARGEGGLAKPFVEGMGKRELLVSTILALAMAALLLGLKGIVMVGVIGLLSLSIKRYFHWKLGGITGDILGATNETSEVASLLGILVLTA